jgi:hypothetical protein
MREQTERVREQTERVRERLVGHAEAGSYVTYLWRREQWLPHGGGGRWRWRGQPQGPFCPASYHLPVDPSV